MSRHILIKNGILHDAVSPGPKDLDILVTDGKIAKIGGYIRPPKGTETIDATGLQIWPGLVEAHSHIGMENSGTLESGDYNERNDAIVPQLEAIDGVDPFCEELVVARNAGVTCVATGPGSANVLGGTFIAIKTFGRRIEDMVVKRKVAMKCAFGENPKRCYASKSVSSRMTTAAKLREMLFKAKEYLAKKEAAGDDKEKLPAFDFKLEALIPVITREIPLKAHAHRADDIFTAIRIAREFEIKLTIEHCTDGSLISDILAKEGFPVAIGPTFSSISKPELRNKSFTTPAELVAAGCKVSIITDSGVIPQQHLAMMAGMAIRSGLDPFEALKAVTINPARHIGCEERVGSIEPGKDADIVITEGNLFSLESKIIKVLIEGNTVFEASWEQNH
ncbi:MAG: amidohydrolase [Lentisphaerae bacterium]|jgi:imidazolonepropionase-like amidohydrolase|nr:amidohydrolase [Lentisphaerota bacterium]